MKFLLVLIGVVVFSSHVFAQAGNHAINSTVSFAGNWVLDKKKSGGPGVTVLFAESSMVVTHDAREIVMISTTTIDGKQSVSKTVYSIDGTIKEREIVDGGFKVPAKWNGKKLVRITKSVVAAIKQGGRSPVMETKEEWELSKDGKILKQTIIGVGMPGVAELRSTFVYSRAAN